MVPAYRFVRIKMCVMDLNADPVNSSSDELEPWQREQSVGMLGVWG